MFVRQSIDIYKNLIYLSFCLLFLSPKKFKLRFKHVTMKKGTAILLIFVSTTLIYSTLFNVFEGGDILTSLYWTIITMATIGYGDITPKTTNGKILAMIIAVSGIAIYTAFASVIVDYITERNIKRIQGLMDVKEKDHIVIVGWNEATKETLKELKANIDCEVVVISDRPIEHRCVVGDPTDEDTLKKTGIDRARFVIVSTGDDSKTVLTTLTVRKINPDVYIIAEALRSENVELLRFAGANSVILSEGFAGRLLASAVFEGSVVKFFEEVSTSYRGEDVFEIPANDLVDLSFLDAMIKLKGERNYILVGIVRENVLINPNPDEKIRKGDRLLVIGRKGV